MPFMRIEFCPYYSGDSMQKTLREQFIRFFRPIEFVLSILCCRIRCLTPKGRAGVVIERCHVVFLVVFLIIILSILLLQVRLHLQLTAIDLRASSSLVLTMFQAQGFANLLFLIYWDRQNVAEAIRRSLNSSSTGIGVLRRRNTLNNIQVASMLCGCILSLLLVCFTVVQLFTIHSSASVDQHQQSEHHYQQIYLKWARLCVFVYLSISFPAAYAQIATFTGIISAEYKSLNDDFMEDVNTYQLPVAKHYVSAHWKLGNTFNLYQRSLSLWMSVHLMTSFASLAFIWISVPSVRSILQQFESSIEIQRVFELTFGFVLLLLTILTIIALVIVSLLVRFHSTRMRHSMIALIASDRILHEQTYSLAIAYINHLHRRGLGIMFFEIALIDRHFIIKTLFVMVFTAIVLRY